jgi:kynureninase
VGQPRIADSLAPTDVGWFSHESPFEFDIARFEYRPGALRFWGGTPSVLPYAIAAASIGELARIGVDAIRSVNLAHTGRIISAAQGLGIPISTPLAEHERGGTVALKFSDSEAAAMALQARGIRCDWRPRSGVRLSPHVFNTEDESTSRGGAAKGCCKPHGLETFEDYRPSPRKDFTQLPMRA